MAQDSSYMHLACVHYVRPTAMPCRICRKDGHNIRTCKALSEAKSDVISKRHELAMAETALAKIEKQWRNYHDAKTPTNSEFERGEKKDLQQMREGVVINVNNFIDVSTDLGTKSNHTDSKDTLQPAHVPAAVVP